MPIALRQTKPTRKTGQSCQFYVLSLCVKPLYLSQSQPLAALQIKTLRDHPLREKRGNRFGKTQLFFFSFFDFFHAVDGTLKPKNQLSETAFFFLFSFSPSSMMRLTQEPTLRYSCSFYSLFLSLFFFGPFYLMRLTQEPTTAVIFLFFFGAAGVTLKAKNQLSNTTANCIVTLLN